MTKARTLELDDPIVQVAVFGKEVEDFLASDIGLYLLRRARLEEEEGIDELVKTPETRKTKATDTELRNAIWRAQKIREWLEVAVNEGLQAIQILEERND